MADKSQNCNCSRRRRREMVNKRRERRARLKQLFVCNPDEEFYHEPYMPHLREEVSQVSSRCSSGIELPWKDIAICAADLAKIESSNDTEELVKIAGDKEKEAELVRKESSGLLHLPWEDLMITNTVDSERSNKDMEKCDSSMEIPWHDILFDPNLNIHDSNEDMKKCDNGEVEIPWGDLLVPKNIVLIPKNKYLSYKQMPKKNNKKCGCSMSKK